MKSLLIDSSGWIEIFRQGRLAKKCQKELHDASEIIVPTLVIFEVYRKICKSISEDQALSCVALMSQNHVVDLTREIALTAADLSIKHDLPMADSLVLAHAYEEEAMLLTLDNDFNKISGTLVIR